MVDVTNLKLQYVTNETGKRTAVILPIEDFEELLEDIEDLKVIIARQRESTVPHSQVITELKHDDLIQD